MRNGIAGVLRLGTLVAIAAVGIGYALTLLGGARPGSTPLVTLLQGGGGPAIVGLGLFALTLLPAVVLGVAVVGLRRAGERRLAWTALVTLLLLLASLAVAVAVGLALIG